MPVLSPRTFHIQAFSKLIILSGIFVLQIIILFFKAWSEIDAYLLLYIHEISYSSFLS